MPNFEVYKRTHFGKRTSQAATVTIQMRGRISFSPPAIAALGSPEAVTFLYDQEAQLIGFRKARRSEPSAYPVRAPRSGVHIVSGRGFCEFIGLDLSESRRYPLVLMDGTHCIDLREAGVPVTSNRRKATQPQA
jgi:hypothetical protein